MRASTDFMECSGEDPLLHMMDAVCFPDDTPANKSQGDWWILYDNDEPAAFTGVKTIAIGDEQFAYFFNRDGVMPRFRGRGLQRRLIEHNLKWAANRGPHALGLAVTYVVPEGVISGNNYLKCGFKLWRPFEPWAGPNAVYMAKKLFS